MTSAQSRNRVAGFGMASGASQADNGRTSTRAFGLGNGTNTWSSNSGSIWGNSTYGAPSKGAKQDAGRIRTEPFGANPNRDMATGSGSLLPSSESDHNGTRGTPWHMAEAPDISSMNNSHSGTSPTRRHTHAAYYRQPNFVESSNSETIFPYSQPTKSSQYLGLDPTSRDFVASDLVRKSHNPYANHDEDSLYEAGRGGSGSGESGLSLADRAPRGLNRSGYNSNVPSRNGSLPPSRGDIDPSSRNRSDVQTLQSARLAANTNAPRLNASGNAAPFAMPSGFSDHHMVKQNCPSGLDSLTGLFDHLNLGNQARRPSYASSQHSPSSASDHFPNVRTPTIGARNPSNQWMAEDHLRKDQLTPTDSASGFMRQHSFRGGFDSHFSQSFSDNNTLVDRNSLYANNGTPSNYNQHNANARSHQMASSKAQTAVIDRRLHGLQQQQQGFPSQHNPIAFRPQMSYPFNVEGQQAYLSPLASYYPVAPTPNVLVGPIPRGPAQHFDSAGHQRSPLLQEFVNNTKTNKQYGIKDIYDHIVEFSGDQHGSRFIQQKLETANSDEKDQVFRELLPNAFQLMTDVFGNYVIQKFFEHGNQSQKKTLASRMEGRVFDLSLQMYGCRVVQKALEHVLTDQQAQLIRELERDVMKCVRDQNGNHVVQKAVERVPAEHIHFIIEALHGNIGANAIHQYGCRVIQRMLEHCDNATRLAVLQELHACASQLISDQYGNYVTQHVIQHGRDEDRGRIINLIINNLVNFSKHKFASNVVEKSIEYGSLEERLRIVQKLTATNERGESPVQSLIRDQYGNYVVQKLLKRLHGQEWVDFAEPVKIQVQLLKKFAYGKQVASVENLLYNRERVPPFLQHSGHLTPAFDPSAASTPPPILDRPHSPQNSSLPTPHNISVDIPYDSRNLSGETLTASKHI